MSWTRMRWSTIPHFEKCPLAMMETFSCGKRWLGESQPTCWTTSENLLSWSRRMIERFANGVIPQSKITPSLSEKAGEVVARAYAHLSRLEFGKALEAIWELVQSTNQYIDKTAPWKLAKKPEAKEHSHEVLLHLAAVLKTLGVVLAGFTPSKGEEIFRQIGFGWNPSSFFLQLQSIGMTCGSDDRERKFPFPKNRTAHTRSQDSERRNDSPTTNDSDTNTDHCCAANTSLCSTNTRSAGADHHRRVHEDST